MLGILISIIGIILTIFFVIGTHEFAHFIVARLLNVRVLRFSIGFGKKLIGFHDKSGTEYVLALVPLGGYVKMLDENEGNVPASALRFAYNRQPFYKKMLIILAGPAMNILCAFLLYWVIFMMGFTAIKPIIGNVEPHSIAALAGLQQQQEIVELDHRPIHSWTGIIFRLMTHAGNQDQLLVTIKTKQHFQTYLLNLTGWHLNALTPDPLGSLGITPYVPHLTKPPFKWPPNLLNHIQYRPFAAIKPAFMQMFDLTYFNLIIFGKIITGKVSIQSLGGPVTIFQSAGDALNSGFLAFISFLAFLSISIGVINLFPVPGLDGGHLAIQFIEFIIRKPVPETVLSFLYRAGFLLIIFIMIEALVNDILRLT